MIEYLSRNPQATQRFGRLLSGCLKPGAVVALSGELAAGKTTLVQGICAGLNIHAAAESPTYTLVNEYRGNYPVYHIDCYREDRLQEWLMLGLHDYLYHDGITLIEWADKIDSILPVDAIRIDLAHHLPERTWRRLILNADPDLEQQLHQRLKNSLKLPAGEE